MGEMADYFLEREMFSVLDGDFNPDDCRQPVTCNRCGAKAVYWEQENGHWRLFQEGTGAPHLCPTTAAGFDEVPDA